MNLREHRAHTTSKVESVWLEVVLPAAIAVVYTVLFLWFAASPAY